MKKIIKFLPAMAILLASGLAVATTSKVSTPNVRWDTAQNEWVSFSGEYLCDSAPELCVAHQDDQDNITNIQFGEFVQLP
jgi:hypothetical protein